MLEPFGYTIFCDDIREEAGGKLSFMGRYLSEMVIGAQAPVLLPKFAAATHVVFPLELQFQTVKMSLQLETAGRTTTLQEVSFAGEPPPRIEGTDHYLFAVNFVISPFNVSGDCLLRALCYLESERMVRCGSLKVRFVEQLPPGDAPTS